MFHSTMVGLKLPAAPDHLQTVHAVVFSGEVVVDQFIMATSTRNAAEQRMEGSTGQKPRQKRSRGKCRGCGREDVELVSSQWADGAQQKICDSCRKDIANHPELEPVAVLLSRRQPHARLATREKL